MTKGAEGLVLSVGRVGGFEEEAGLLDYRFAFTDKHKATVCESPVRVKAEKGPAANTGTRAENRRFRGLGTRSRRGRRLACGCGNQSIGAATPILRTSEKTGKSRSGRAAVGRYC